jgi:purine-nucleoside phosphorylase
MHQWPHSEISSESIRNSAAFIRAVCSEQANIAVIAGTGLGNLEDILEQKIRIPYRDIPHFPGITSEGHKGDLLWGKLKGVNIWLLSGRYHYYEGYSSASVSYPVRVLRDLGVDTLIITNAAGVVNPHFDEADLVVIEDHINLMPDHPLRGPNLDSQGVRFPDMLDAYDPEMIVRVLQIAQQQGIALRQGVYLGLQGPSLETAAEYRMAYRLGADMVGMSTIPEVIVARHCGIRVLAFSVISNVCFPKAKLSHTTIESVVKNVEKAAPGLQSIIEAFIIEQAKTYEQ